ncbi:MAG: putative Clathrin heavy chain 1 [Streblomastix strix]|uniref:Putative Clathrin heavy chain 1 n=4 Tax=Streblomastix strix TaxID=222440 RepID=A0A5J4VU47_9EUKA|nr:MAG: putative Clathrin heavy chain 1 [Streblomastix strix]
MDPIKKRTLMDLTKIVSDPSLISFSQTSLQSETALCCQNLISGEKTVTQLNPRNPTFRAQNRMAAELVVPHPKKNILAVKGGQLLQIYDLDLQAKLKSTKMTENIEYMKWVDEKTLVLVSSTNVYEWGLDSESNPEVLFIRLSQLAGWNISNFRTDGKRVWCLLLASSVDPQSEKLIGSMQIYNREKKMSQYVPAHTGIWNQATLNEVSPVASRATALRASAGIIYTDPNDFPVAIEYSERCGLILLVSAKVNTEDGLIGVNVQGQVLQIGVDERAIVPYITQKLQNVPLAVRIAGLAKLNGCEDFFIQQFEANFLAQNYREAAKMAAIAPGGVLRTPQIIQRFKTALSIGGGVPPIMQYLAVLFERFHLNEYESLELVGHVVKQGRKDMAEGWLRDGKITASEPLGNFLRTVDLNFALSEYLSCGAHEKAVQTYAELGELDKLIAYCKQTGYRALYGDLLRGLFQVKGEWAEQFALKLVQNPEGPLIDVSEAMKIMFSKEFIKELTGLMLEVLKADFPEQNRLQT